VGTRAVEKKRGKLEITFAHDSKSEAGESLVKG